MNLLPDNIDLEIFDAESANYSTRTFKRVGNRIFGFTDGRDAIEQAVEKILNSERYSTPIWNGDYGVEIEELIGMDINFVRADIKRRITEALVEDDRVIEVTNFRMESTGLNELLVSFSVETTEGPVEFEKSFNV